MKLQTTDPVLEKKILHTIQRVLGESNDERKLMLLCAIHIKKYGNAPLKSSVSRFENKAKNSQQNESLIIDHDDSLIIDFEESYTNYTWYMNIHEQWKKRLKKLKLVEEFIETKCPPNEHDREDIEFIVEWLKCRIT